MRFLIALLAGAVLFFVAKALLSGPSETNTQRRRQNKRANNEKMVPCAVCELHLPQSEAVIRGDKFFCTEEHAKQWKSQNS